MKRSARRLFLSLFLLVLFVWSVFSLLAARAIDASEQQRLNLAADRILEEIGDAFYDLEQLSFVIGHHEDVLGMLRTDDMSEYYRLAQKAESLVRRPAQRPDFISQVVLYNGQSKFYRLAGGLSNTACAQIWYMHVASELPVHFVSTLDGVKHIGYASAVDTGDGKEACLVAMLFEEDVLLNLFEASIGDEPLDVALLGKGEVIVATSDAIAGAHAIPVENQTASNAKATRRVGVTPFEIVVSSTRHANLPTTYFVLSAVVSAVLFGALFFLFTRLLHQRFLNPMYQVIQNVAQLDVDMPGSELIPVHNAEFDTLVDSINGMLHRLAIKNDQIKAAELRTKNAEVERQAAVIVSLKKQINAHFTINTLGSVKTLIEQAETARARVMLTKLSALVRYAHDRDEFINAWEEFSVLADYIDIMNVRHGNSIQSSFDLDDRLMNYRMPRMLLQPIVENAIVHGFQNRREGNHLQISAILDDTSIEIFIQDNGRGMVEAELSALHVRLQSNEAERLKGIDHIALMNVQRRIASYYGVEGRLAVNSAAGTGTIVRILLPTQMQKREN